MMEAFRVNTFRLSSAELSGFANHWGGFIDESWLRPLAIP